MEGSVAFSSVDREAVDEIRSPDVQIATPSEYLGANSTIIF